MLTTQLVMMRNPYRESVDSGNIVAKDGVINFFAYYILYSIMVPISLYVSMELVRVPQALLINCDIEVSGHRQTDGSVPTAPV